MVIINEVRNMFKPKNEILKNLQEYIKTNSKIETWVGTKKIYNKTPVIILEEPINELLTRSTTYDNTVRSLNYKINIYCEKLKNGYEIIQELVILVAEVMEGYYHMDGGLIAITPVFNDSDKNSWQATMRYTTRYIPSRSKLY